MGISKKSKSMTFKEMEEMPHMKKSKSMTGEKLNTIFDPIRLAHDFCELDDESQADFFIQCSMIAKQWERDQASQWFDLGVHLRECECSNDDARRMIKAIKAGMDFNE